MTRISWFSDFVFHCLQYLMGLYPTISYSTTATDPVVLTGSYDQYFLVQLIYFLLTIQKYEIAHEQFLAWAWLGLPRPKAIVVIPKNRPLPNIYGKKRVKVRSTPATTLQKKIIITMYLRLDIILKLKFTTIFDRCAILYVLNYLTKNFEF